MPKAMNATEVRNQFGAVLRTVQESGEPVIVVKHGVPVAAIVPLEEHVLLTSDQKQDRRKLVQRSRDAFAPLRGLGWNPDWAEFINAGREDRDHRLFE